MVELTNRFKGLDLVARVPERTIHGGLKHCTGGGDQNHPKGKELQEGKTVV